MIGSYYDKRIVGCPGGEGGKSLFATLIICAFWLHGSFTFVLDFDHLIFAQTLTEDEHDVVWFWLEKGKPHECPVCSQYFVVS